MTGVLKQIISAPLLNNEQGEFECDLWYIQPTLVLNFLFNGPYFVKLCLVKGWSDRGLRITSTEENEVELIFHNLLNTNYSMQHINENNFI